MAWAILFTVTFIHGANLGFVLLNLFKNSPEPTGRRPERIGDIQTNQPLMYLLPAPKFTHVLKKVNWKEEGF